MIPEFNGDGLLPEGVHSATWEEVIERFGSNEQRLQLLDGLTAALDLLRAAGCRRVFINGSFVTAKRRPNDIDVCWDSSGVDPDALDPVFLDFANERAAQKARFGAEFFPTEIYESITKNTFLEFFQVDKQTGAAKGIIELGLDDG